MKRSNISKVQIEQLDINIIYISNKVRRKIKGLRRIIPYLKENVRQRAVV